MSYCWLSSATVLVSDSTAISASCKQMVKELHSWTETTCCGLYGTEWKLSCKKTAERSPETDCCSPVKVELLQNSHIPKIKETFIKVSHRFIYINEHWLICYVPLSGGVVLNDLTKLFIFSLHFASLSPTPVARPVNQLHFMTDGCDVWPMAGVRWWWWWYVNLAAFSSGCRQFVLRHGLMSCTEEELLHMCNF